MYHFLKLVNNKDRIVTGVFPMMSRYWEELQVSIVFSGNKFLSLLDGGVLLVMQNSLNILPAIKLILD